MRAVCRAVLLAFLVASTVQAGVISRPTKTCGTTTYATEVTAGCVTIKSAEVDGDLNPLYTLVNGQLDSTNVASLNGSKITPASVAGNKLVGTVTTNSQVAATAGTISANAGVDQTIATLAAMTTTTSATVMLGGNVGWTYNESSTADHVIVKWKRDGTAICTTSFSTQTAGGGQALLPLPTPDCIDVAPAAGSHTYSLTVQFSASILIVDTNPGKIYGYQIP